MNDPHNHARFFAANVGGSLWWVADQLYRHGPRWELVPPLLLATASLIGSLKLWLDGSMARRHADEMHRAQLAALKRPCPPGMERLN